MLEWTSYADAAIRLILAVLFGAALGWEREEKRKPAGLRTHMMVALGAASVTLVASRLAEAAPADAPIQIDPTRIVEGVVGGIGFLGAGTIIQARGSVEGITTAASIWVMGAVGVACGLGQFFIAAATVLLGLIILRLVLFLEGYLFH